jgi:hypothetical protein
MHRSNHPRVTHSYHEAMTRKSWYLGTNLLLVIVVTILTQSQFTGQHNKVIWVNTFKTRKMSKKQIYEYRLIFFVIGFLHMWHIRNSSPHVLHTVCPHRNAMSLLRSIQMEHNIFSSISVNLRWSVEFWGSLLVVAERSCPKTCLPSEVNEDYFLTIGK